MIRLSRRVVSNQHLILATKEDYLLGPDLMLRECTIEINCPAEQVTLLHTTFDACSLAINKRFTNFEWFPARFQNCVFGGDLVGLRFGAMPDDEIDSFGGVANCSFENAVLHFTDFLNVDLSTVLLPRWPCFTILNPAARTDLASLPWPAQTHILMETYMESSIDTAGITAHAPEVVRQFGSSEGELKAFLEGMPDVIL
jgi:hypothetical protein